LLWTLFLEHVIICGRRKIMADYEKLRVAVMASGSASTLAAVVQAGIKNDLGYQVGLVIGDHPERTRPTVNRLNWKFGLKIPFEEVNSWRYPRRENESTERGITNAESERICELLEQYGPFAAVATLGYMMIIRGQFMEEHGWKLGDDPRDAAIVNTHPGILPETVDTYGVNASARVLALGLAATAHTFHAVSEKVDAGPVLASTPVPVLPGDTPETLFDRVQVAEKAGLPWMLDRFLRERQKRSRFLGLPPY
jgi:folate-dependent phosphoribosylglycinamide formyltransferase PurN